MKNHTCRKYVLKFWFPTMHLILNLWKFANHFFYMNILPFNLVLSNITLKYSRIITQRVFKFVKILEWTVITMKRETSKIFCASFLVFVHQFHFSTLWKWMKQIVMNWRVHKEHLWFFSRILKLKKLCSEDSHYDEFMVKSLLTSCQ